MRAFIAVPISDESKETVASLISDLSGGNFKIVQKENFHLTLKFLGEIDENQLEAIKTLLENFSKTHSKFQATLNSVGAFPNEGHVKVLWVGLAPQEEYEKMAQELDQSIHDIGFKKEKSYTPHVTFSRVKYVDDKEKIKAFLQKHKNEDFGEVQIDRIILMKSELTPEGPTYTEISSYPLT
ncbi:RNA 2',3'-cyclic phosphodiesterase [Candidatus Undinarchaeota archaeon]